MKKQIIIALLVGVVLGAGISYLFHKRVQCDTSHAGTTHTIESLDTSDITVVAFDSATQKDVVSWVDSFQVFNQTLKSKQLQLEPIFWGKGITPVHNGDDVTCGIESWYISKKKFKNMYDLDGMEGFKIYPALRYVDVIYNEDGDTFEHGGMTLVFTPADEDGRNLVNANGVVAFEYVDPCPKICKQDPNDLVNLTSDIRIPQQCN